MVKSAAEAGNGIRSNRPATVARKVMRERCRTLLGCSVAASYRGKHIPQARLCPASFASAMVLYVTQFLALRLYARVMVQPGQWKGGTSQGLRRLEAGAVTGCVEWSWPNLLQRIFNVSCARYRLVSVGGYGKEKRGTMTRGNLARKLTLGVEYINGERSLTAWAIS